VTLLAAAVFGRPIQGQNAPSIRVGGVEISGIPEDWSNHYVVFSNPGTEEEAIQNGNYAQWQRIVNEPRYVIQQMKRNAPVEGPSAADVEYRSRWISEATDPRTSLEAPEESGQPDGFWPFPRQPIFKSMRIAPSDIKKDWSQALGGPGLAASHFPAKYSFISPGAASCSDYVVFPTGAAGSASQATIVAFTNLYVGGGCGSTNPTVYWAYNTGSGAIASLSPVLSLDGTQVAFIQTASSVASLVILKMAATGGSVGAPTFGTGAGSVTAANYRACTAPCYTAITLNGSPNDTNSAQFYRYDGSDTLYVGDNSGKLHQFTGVFNGTPAETTTTGWPVTASTKTTPALNSPVYDSGGSTLVFVTDATGYLNSVTTTGTTTQTVLTSNQMTCGTLGFVGPTLVDSSTEQVYAFIGDGCDKTPGDSFINRFPAGTSISASYGANSVSYGNASTNTTSTINRVGTFDNLYFTGSGNTGNLYACVNGVMYQIPMAGLSGTTTGLTANTFSTAVSTVSSTSTCSRVTEFLGAKANTTLTASLGTTGNPTVASTTGMAVGDYLQIDSEIMQITAVTPTLTVSRGSLGTTAATHSSGAAVQDIEDWLFMSVAANGNVAGCTGACLYNYLVTTGSATGTPTAGLAATGGTSGIIIDNSSTTQVGAQQIYYSILGGTSAVQASQSAP
jgi:hypothetical protein